MIIKKFVGKTEEDATVAARDELGDGIVIMNVRPVKKTGFFAFFQSPKTEVTVALEEEPDVGIVTKKDILSDAAKNANVVKEESDEIVFEKSVENSSVGLKLAKASKNGTLPPLKINDAKFDTKALNGDSNGALKNDLKEKAKTRDGELSFDSAKGESSFKEKKAQDFFSDKNASKGVDLSNASFGDAVFDRSSSDIKKSSSVKTSGIEEKIDSLQTLLEKNIEQKSQAKNLSAEKMKEMPSRVNVKDNSISDEMLSFVKLLYNTMIENEVDEKYVNDLTDEIEKLEVPGVPLEYALSNVYQKMILKFGDAKEITPSKDGPKAEIFIGPTGVGKTTTIAKLASNLSVTMHKKVALITMDTYRIAAAEQLRTYASILEIPFRVIYSVEEIEQAAKDFEDMDYIMVDTAGHSVHNKEQYIDIKSYVEALEKAMDTEVFLVMSATTKYRDLIEIADKYKEDFDYSLIFTKMDETNAAGNLYNIRLHTNAPISYITNGQNVPDDIAVFDAQKIVKALLGGNKSDGSGDETSNDN